MNDILNDQAVEVLTSLTQPLVLREAGKCLICLSALLLPLSLCGYIGSLRHAIDISQITVIFSS